jgi:hypothetical protein
MPKFIPYDYNQTSMVVINFQDQLQPGTFEYAVHYSRIQFISAISFKQAVRIHY